MKKYIIFAVVLSMIAFSSAQAKDGEVDTSSSGTGGKGGMMIRGGVNGGLDDTDKINELRMKDNLAEEKAKGLKSEGKLGDVEKVKEFRREDMRNQFKAERDAFKEKLKTEKDSFLAELKAKKEEWKNTKEDKKIEFCGKVKEVANTRFSIAITKLEEVQAKVAEFITKLKAEGKDTTLAEEALNVSKTKLADAKAKLAEVKALVPESCTDVTPEVFEKIKLGAREAKDLLKESRENLKQSIKELKTLRGEDQSNSGDEDKTTNNEAETTPTTTTQ